LHPRERPGPGTFTSEIEGISERRSSNFKARMPVGKVWSRLIDDLHNLHKNGINTAQKLKDALNARGGLFWVSMYRAFPIWRLCFWPLNAHKMP
jgi:hypothetical protein